MTGRNCRLLCRRHPHGLPHLHALATLSLLPLLLVGCEQQFDLGDRCPLLGHRDEQGEPPQTAVQTSIANASNPSASNAATPASTVP